MRYVLSVALGILCSAPRVSAQTAEELLAKNTQAKGGIDKVKAVKTLQKTGHLQQGGFVAAVGEERLREFLGGLYGDVNGYDGRPTDEQTARADALGRELDDVIHEFTTVTNQRLPR